MHKESLSGGCRPLGLHVMVHSYTIVPLAS